MTPLDKQPITYVPGVRQGLFQINDATEDESKNSGEVLPFVRTDGDLNEPFRHRNTFFEIGRLQDRSLAPEAQLRKMRTTEV